MVVLLFSSFRFYVSLPDGSSRIFESSNFQVFLKKNGEPLAHRIVEHERHMDQRAALLDALLATTAAAATSDDRIQQVRAFISINDLAPSAAEPITTDIYNYNYFNYYCPSSTTDNIVRSVENLRRLVMTSGTGDDDRITRIARYGINIARKLLQRDVNNQEVVDAVNRPGRGTIVWMYGISRALKLTVPSVAESSYDTQLYHKPSVPKKYGAACDTWADLVVVALLLLRPTTTSTAALIADVDTAVQARRTERRNTLVQLDANTQTMRGQARSSGIAAFYSSLAVCLDLSDGLEERFKPGRPWLREAIAAAAKVADPPIHAIRTFLAERLAAGDAYYEVARRRCLNASVERRALKRARAAEIPKDGDIIDMVVLSPGQLADGRRIAAEIDCEVITID